MERSVVIEELTPDWALQLVVTISKKENCKFRHKITDSLYVKEPVIYFTTFL